MTTATQLRDVKIGTRVKAIDGLGGERRGQVCDHVEGRFGFYLQVAMEDGSFDSMHGVTDVGIGWYIDRAAGEKRPAAKPTDVEYVRHKGDKYDSGMDVADIAKAIRRDIKAAIAAGEIHAGTKTSVRISRFSMGQSIDIRIDAAPVLVLNPEHVRWSDANPHSSSFDAPTDAKCWLSQGASALKAKLEEIANAYQRSETHSQSDYHNTNFFLDVTFDHKLTERQRREISEAHRQGLRVREKVSA